jgi:hypothetical protein
MSGTTDNLKSRPQIFDRESRPQAVCAVYRPLGGKVTRSQSTNRMTLTRSPSAMGIKPLTVIPVAPVGLGGARRHGEAYAAYVQRTGETDTVKSWRPCNRSWPTPQ